MATSEIIRIITSAGLSILCISVFILYIKCRAKLWRMRRFVYYSIGILMPILAVYHGYMVFKLITGG